MAVPLPLRPIRWWRLRIADLHYYTIYDTVRFDGRFVCGFDRWYSCAARHGYVTDALETDAIQGFLIWELWLLVSPRWEELRHEEETSEGDEETRQHNEKHQSPALQPCFLAYSRLLIAHFTLPLSCPFWTCLPPLIDHLCAKPEPLQVTLTLLPNLFCPPSRAFEPSVRVSNYSSN